MKSTGNFPVTTASLPPTNVNESSICLQSFYYDEKGAGLRLLPPEQHMHLENLP
ncbi:hypothetical protein Bca4012_037478 [Brassica carinata]